MSLSAAIESRYWGVYTYLHTLFNISGQDGRRVIFTLVPIYSRRNSWVVSWLGARKVLETNLSAPPEDQKHIHHPSIDNSLKQ